MEYNNTLFELTGIWKEVLLMAQNAETPEDIQMWQDTMESVNLVIEDKINGCCHVIEKLDHNIDALNAEINRRKEKLQTIKNNKQRLKDYMKSCMQIADIKKCDTNDFNVSIAKAGGKQTMKILVGINDIPKELDCIKFKKEIDKNKLREYIDSYSDKDSEDKFIEIDGKRIAELEPRKETIRIK